MSLKILVGPLLGYEEGNYYTVCLLTAPMATAPTLTVSDKSTPLTFVKQAMVGRNVFWRTEFKVPESANGTCIQYRIKNQKNAMVDQHARGDWTFYVPGKSERPRIGYGSCNGFSSAKVARDTDEPYALWQRMNEGQEERLSNVRENRKGDTREKPLSLLLLGGDQVYADEIWESRCCPSLQRWAELSWEEQNAADLTVEMEREIEEFYAWLYLDRWKNEHMSFVLATIPSVMMWDDHDIFDGWGSYPTERQECDVFKKVFIEAARVFDVFQLRCSSRNRLNPVAMHRGLRLQFGDYAVLALDNRSERTKEQIMSWAHWDDVKNWLNGLGKATPVNLLVLSAVPVVYRSFTAVEKLFETTPWHEELEDDVQDHWSATSHQAERMKFIMVLLDFLAAYPKTRCLILSGDVHVGALGQIWDERRQVGITQIVSSGMVHPPPTALAWMGLRLMTSDDPERLGEGDIVAEMLAPIGSDRYLRTRNFATLFTGTDDKVWVNWTCENPKLKPSFAVAWPEGRSWI